MNALRNSSLLKLLIGLVVIALLTGCAYNAVFGIAFTVLPADDWAGAVLNTAMEGQTNQATDYYFLQKEYADAKEADIPQWAKLEMESYESSLNPENTNFRYGVFQGGEQIFGNYSGEPTIAVSYNWEQKYIGTELDRQRLVALERDWAYDYENDVALQGVGGEVYEVPDSWKMPDKYVYYDVYGNYYDENGAVIAYNGNYYDENGNFIHVVEEPQTDNGATIVFDEDGTKYYPIDPDEGFPEYFAYRNEYGKIFDSDLNFIMYEDEYVNGYDMGEPVPTPTPKPVTQSGMLPIAATPKPTATPKPRLVELKPLTDAEREGLYSACYEEYAVRGYVLADMTVEDGYSALYDEVMDYAAGRETYLQNAIGLGIGGLVLLAILLVLAGKRNDEGEHIASGSGRLPWDVWFVGFCCLAVGAGALVFVAAEMVMEALYYRGLEVNVEFVDLAIKGCIAAAAVCVALVVGMLHSVAARVKVKGWWRSCLTWKLCVWLWKLCVKCLKWCWKLWLKIWGWCKGLLAGFGGAVKKIPLIWKAVVILGGIAVVQFMFFAMNTYDGSSVVVALLWNIVLFLLGIIICLMLKRLQEGARTIADGDLEHRIDTKNLYLDFKEHAECLNRIGEGLSHNVDARLRSERMKTELITNVSHDLKTPLTSIVNYVDLLKKEHLEGTAAEYVEVLDRQSARLKKLTEDLVEASKASSGALNVTVERLDLAELLEQAQAEYAGRLMEHHLQPIVRVPDGEVTVWADGKYVWRILDNLLSNVCKYAMPNTRVYLELRTESEAAVLSVKNMSRESLNVSAEELMERFVRGDASRNTEGSGLGLSIAQSLAKLMGGEVRLTVDGDLFKAEVVLPMEK